MRVQIVRFARPSGDPAGRRWARAFPRWLAAPGHAILGTVPALCNTAMSERPRRAANQVYAAPEIEARLRSGLPRWTFDGGAICRTYTTTGWKSTLMVVNAIGHLAEVAWHHPDLEVSYPKVVVRLMSHDANGVTDKDFALARKIEEVVTWRPAREPGAVLEGTPEDPRYKYLEYD